ncbi:unnamed protein product [Lathyrus sativus]|nr:unnamed protein product [Lathyrus sativus]
MIVRSLNIRGGDNLSKRKRINCLIKSGNADLFFIQESKLKLVEANLVKELGRKKEVGWSYCSSIGFSGGIITLWNESIFSPVFSFKGGGFLGLN